MIILEHEKKEILSLHNRHKITNLIKEQFGFLDNIAKWVDEMLLLFKEDQTLIKHLGLGEDTYKSILKRNNLSSELPLTTLLTTLKHGSPEDIKKYGNAIIQVVANSKYQKLALDAFTSPTYLEVLHKYTNKITPEFLMKKLNLSTITDEIMEAVILANSSLVHMSLESIYKRFPKIQLKLKGVWQGIGLTKTKKLSGWKFHIYGETAEDAAILADRLDPILKKWGLHGKVLTEGILLQNTRKTNQWGKAGTIYITPEIIKAGMAQDLTDDVVRALGDYKKSGEIYGDKSINGTLHYRYEFKSPFDVTEGVLWDDVHANYRGNDGLYNINGNPDLFEVNVLQSNY